MKSSPPRNDIKLVDNALVLALQLTEELDNTAAPEGFRYHADMLFWALEKTNPDVVASLRQFNLLPVLRRRLLQYGELRESTATTLDRYSPYDWAHPIEWPMFEEVAAFLESGKWAPPDRSAPLAFRRIVRKARELPSFSERYDFVKADRTDELMDGVFQTPPADPTVKLPLDVRNDGPLAEALSYAQQQLLSAETGSESFWDSVEITSVIRWLMDDIPETMNAIEVDGQREGFESLLRRHVDRMQLAENICLRLGETIRRLILQSSPDAVRPILEIAVKAAHSGTVENLSAWTDRVLALLHRVVRARAASIKVLVHRESDSSPAIDSIRQDARPSVGYVIRRDDLPTRLAESVQGQWCLALNIADSKIDDLEILKPMHLESFFLVHQATYVRQLSFSRDLWFQHDALGPLLPRFRRFIPVLYISRHRCVLVQYPVDLFNIMKNISSLSVEYVPTVEVDDAMKVNDRDGNYQPILIRRILAAPG
ncbi:hypothetical protein [Trinickia mobilis]|uniref:hypothetical protein n=1 Tax=Trinickia mobilis TaxID=2816356 RepID=UPI001A8DA271|nr:hypothetical protein [Trinickia mobilis]